MLLRLLSTPSHHGPFGLVLLPTRVPRLQNLIPWSWRAQAHAPTDCTTLSLSLNVFHQIGAKEDRNIRMTNSCEGFYPDQNICWLHSLGSIVSNPGIGNASSRLWKCSFGEGSFPYCTLGIAHDPAWSVGGSTVHCQDEDSGFGVDDLEPAAQETHLADAENAMQ